MALSDWLRGLLLALFGRPRPKPEPKSNPEPEPEPEPTYPTEWTRSVFDGPAVHVALHFTREPIEAKAHDRVMRNQFYHDSFREHLRIAPPEESDDLDRRSHPVGTPKG